MRGWKRSKPTNIIQTIYQSFETSDWCNVRNALPNSDIVIAPDVGPYDEKNLRDASACIDAGREAAEAAFAAFPNLQLIASTARHADAADSNRLVARVDMREGGYQTEEIAITGIVDRLGAGDAFAAGVLHALIEGGDARAAAEAGLALTALKHSLPGDASLFTRADLAAFQAGGMDVRR